MNYDFFTKDNIHLGLLNIEDKDTFLNWYNDPLIRENIGGMIPFSENEFLEAYQMKQRLNPPNLWFSIFLDKQLIGISGLHQIKYIQRNAEISILIGRQEFRGKNIASKVIDMMADYSFNYLQMHRLYAYVFSDNTPSMQLFLKLNWCKEGRLREAAYWNGKFRDIIVFGKLNPAES